MKKNTSRPGCLWKTITLDGETDNLWTAASEHYLYFWARRVTLYFFENLCLDSSLLCSSSPRLLRGVFRIQSNNCDGAFLLKLTIFSKKLHRRCLTGTTPGPLRLSASSGSSYYVKWTSYPWKAPLINLLKHNAKSWAEPCIKNKNCSLS